MDVLRPQLINKDGRCYRLNNPDFGEARQSGVEWDDYPSNYGNNDCTQDEPCDGGDDFDIVSTDDGKFITSFYIARVYYGRIIGTKAQTKKRLEAETRTIIKVPPRNLPRNPQPQDNEIVITGSTRQDVASARQRIQLIALSCRRKLKFTHFFSTPMALPSVKERFLLFKQQALQDCQASGVDESVFQDPEKLHLTIAMLVLTDNVECSEAIKVLERCKQDVIDPLMEGNSITILLSGVDIMNDDPTQASVVYATVHANEILQRLVDDIVGYCSDRDLLDKQFERVKLHVTIMNTQFRNGDTGQERSKRRETFDSGPILEMFQDFVFGEVTIDTIHLSTLSTKSKIDGYYEAVTKISLLL